LELSVAVKANVLPQAGVAVAVAVGTGVGVAGAGISVGFASPVTAPFRIRNSELAPSWKLLPTIAETIGVIGWKAQVRVTRAMSPTP
jgi:hypothetical protein